MGFYNGGVPRANRGSVRGESLGRPGNFHSPGMHNFINNQHPDSHRVTQEEATKFKHFMGTDKADFLRTMPAAPMYYDSNFNYMKDRDFWLKFLFGIAAVSYGIKRYNLESDRHQMAQRMEGFKGMPGHHFTNKGGVVV